METFMQNAANTPGGIGDNRYLKTSEYQVTKVLRTIIRLLEIATKAIFTLVKDVFKGIVGKS